jgi:uncharacterized membrane protein (UPF0127 family)
MTSHFLSPLLRKPDAPLRLLNSTRNIVLATNVEGALDSASRKRGLLGRPGLAADAALIIAPSNAIHMFGMRFPIDVLFARRNGEVVKRVVAIKRGRIAIAWRAFAAIELMANHPGVAATEVGDVLVLAPDDTAGR